MFSRIQTLTEATVIQTYFSGSEAKQINSRNALADNQTFP